MPIFDASSAVSMYSSSLYPLQMISASSSWWIAMIGEELRLAAGLEAIVERPPELDDLLDDGAVLVDLDRIHAAVRPVYPYSLIAPVNAPHSCSMRERKMSEKRSRIGSWMPRAVSSLMSSFISMLPGIPSEPGETARLPCSFTEKYPQPQRGML